MSLDLDKKTSIEMVSGGNKPPLLIFKTEDDRTGIDISKMSNFYDSYIHEMTLSIRESSRLQEIMELPIADLSIIGDVINQADIIAQGNITLLPDFENLPSDVRMKLKKGIYSIGESKQVEDNLRAVILDENGVRVKDITLKKVINNPGNVETMRSIGNQMQMRQIYAKLSEIQEFQTYQIQRDRDRDIIVPFLNARQLVLEAATKKSEDEQMRMLKAADDRIRTAINAVYTDIETTSKCLAKKVSRPFGYFSKTPNTYMGFIADDLQIATKFVGVRLQILEYFGERETAKLVLENYQSRMLSFIEQPISKRGLSASMLMHDYFPYNDSNMDFWYNFSVEMKPALKKSMDQLKLETTDSDNKEVYFVSVEDSEDE